MRCLFELYSFLSVYALKIQFIPKRDAVAPVYFPYIGAAGGSGRAENTAGHLTEKPAISRPDDYLLHI
jgi:hypothetical protein